MTFEEILEKIINIEQEVYMLFIELANLEITGKDNSQEYREKIELLESKIEEESFYFNPKVLDIEWLLELDEFFEKEIKPEYFNNSLNELDIERIYIRAYQLLEYAIDMNILEEKIKSLLPKDEDITIDSVIKYIFPTKRKLYKKYYEAIFEQKAISYSLNDRIYYIEEAIESEKDNYTKKDLQMIKYFIAFCDSPFMPNITKILPKGPLTKIIHEQIIEDSSSLKANTTDFLSIIDDIMFEDINDYIENLLETENNLSGKKATIAQIKAILPFLSKTNLEIINDCFKEKIDTITKQEIKDLISNELESRNYYNVGKSELKPEIRLELTDDLIDLIKNLINIDHSIYKIYEKLITLKLQNKENTKEFENWLENLKDGYKIEKQYLKQIKLDYDYIIQLTLALDSDSLHLYCDEKISKIELLNIKTRIKNFIEPIYNNLIIKEQLSKSKNLETELTKEQKDNDLLKFLQKMFSIETFKTVQQEINNHTGNIQKELVADQFSTAFTNYFFTDTLIEANFNPNNLPQINSDYLYIISLELDIDYNYLENKVNEFMFESALQFNEFAQNLESEEGDYSKGYIQFLKAQVKATLPFLNDNQLREIGYKKEKILVK